MQFDDTNPLIAISHNYLRQCPCWWFKLWTLW